LQEDEIQEAVKLASDLSKVGDLLEAETLVKSQRRLIVGVDAAHHHMLSSIARPGYQFAEKFSADASAPPGSMYVDRVLDGIAISQGGAKVSEGGKADDCLLLCRNDGGVSLLGARLPPAQPVLVAHRIFGVDCGRGSQDIVVDCVDTFEISGNGIADYHRASPLKQKMIRSHLRDEHRGVVRTGRELLSEL
jgi:hypothetical protein